MNKIRISPSFSINNAEHKKAVEYIDNNGRNKADYIAKAVLFYEENKISLQENFEFVTRDEVIKLIENRLEEFKFNEPIRSTSSAEFDEVDRNSLLDSLASFK